MTATLETANFEFAKRLQAVSDRDVEQLRAHFLDLAEQFDAGTMGDHTLFPLQMTWFHGEPVWHELTHEQRLMLNRLSFCQSYLTTAVADPRPDVAVPTAAVAAGRTAAATALRSGSQHGAASQPRAPSQPLQLFSSRLHRFVPSR